MKTLYYAELKGHEGITTGDFPVPEITESEVLVRTRAFSLNHVDVWVMNGKYPAKIPLPHIFGSDASGIVEKVGKTVGHVKPGDEVIIYPGLACGQCGACRSGRDNECNSFTLLGVLNNGVSAEYVKAPAENIFRKPEGLSFEEAASVGITYTTAWNSIVLRAGIRQGDTVLVHAAGSGVGTALIQIAKLYHARIITTVGDDWKVEKAKALGADFVVNYKKEDFAEAVKKITAGNLADIAVDHVGAATFNKTLSCLKRGASLVTFGATSGDEVGISLRYLFGKNLRIHGVYVGPKSAVMQYLSLMPAHLKPVIDSVFPVAEARKAYEKLISRQFFGKIIVTL